MKGMKKIICFIITAVLILTPGTSAFAKNNNKNDNGKKHSNQITYKAEKSDKKNQKFKINGSPVIKYGRYKLPISPVTKGMGAHVTYNKDTVVITVEKGNTVIVIDLKTETITVNGIADTTTGIFNNKKNNKMTVLIQYIAKILGCNAYVKDDEIIVEAPGLDYPTNIVVTPVGSVLVPDTLNTTTLFLTATATIKAGQATGGKAELYVGSKLVATDSVINAVDTSVSFTTSDGYPTNAKLQAAVPAGGEVKVKLYNAAGKSVTSKAAKAKLIVDYTAPTITGIASATYDAKSSKMTIAVSGASAIGDKVDVTKLTLVDTNLGRSYQLTNTADTGSKGTVTAADTLTIQIGSTDKLGLAGFGGSTVYLNIAPGSLLSDTSGNASLAFTTLQTVPVFIQQGLDQPTKVTVTPAGSSLANTLNANTLYLHASAEITAGQATGGRAELYVGSLLVATDTLIAATDTTVSFTTSDGDPTNAKLQAIVPTGGEVKVKLYNAIGQSVTSTKDNPTLVVDYIAPTINGISSAIYNVPGNHLYLNVTGAGAVGDKVDVTKISLFDTTQGKIYHLTNLVGKGSTGVVVSENVLRIDIGSVDRQGLAGFGQTTVTMTIAPGSLITDAAGNSSTNFIVSQTVPVTVIK